MAINKVEYGGDTLIDITDTTANAGDVVQGKTFYTADGNRATGTYNETDPVFSASPAAGITASNITVWNDKVDYVSNDPAAYTYTVAHNSNAISLVTVANGNKIDISNVPTTDTVTSTIRKVPTSGAVYDALRDKQDNLVSGTNIKTINSKSIVGSGNVDFYGTELPIGTETYYDGNSVPSGWQEVYDYSTSEINTGKKWVDGKTLYRKVITGTTTTVNAAFTVAHGVSNYDIMMIDNKSFVKSTGGGKTFILPINCPPNTSSDYNKRPVRAYVSTDDISIYIGGYNGYSSFDYAVILEYTKTTD